MRRMLQQVQGEKEAAQGASPFSAAAPALSLLLAQIRPSWHDTRVSVCRPGVLCAAVMHTCALHSRPAAQHALGMAERLFPSQPSHVPPAGFASVLEMQLEGLQDRLHFLQLRRPTPAPPATVTAAAAAAAEEAQQLRRELAAAQQQNRTLRAAAARLSKALTAVIQRAAAGDGASSGGAGAVRGKALGAAGGVAAAAGAAAEVLAQLTAVEGILGGML